MVKKVSTLEVRYHLGELLNRVSLRDDQYVIERKGRPLAAVVPIWQLEKWQKEKAHFFSKIDRIRARNKNVSQEKIEREVSEAVLALRQRGRRCSG